MGSLGVKTEAAEVGTCYVYGQFLGGHLFEADRRLKLPLCIKCGLPKATYIREAAQGWTR